MLLPNFVDAHRLLHARNCGCAGRGLRSDGLVSGATILGLPSNRLAMESCHSRIVDGKCREELMSRDQKVASCKSSIIAIVSVLAAVSALYVPLFFG
jgi:hypothetical protein